MEPEGSQIPLLYIILKQIKPVHIPTSNSFFFFLYPFCPLERWGVCLDTPRLSITS
jgi:hypothetical protein